MLEPSYVLQELAVLLSGLLSNLTDLLLLLNLLRFGIPSELLLILKLFLMSLAEFSEVQPASEAC